MYLGLDLALRVPLWWDVGSAFSPHVLVVGPTGSGKTETLATLARRFREAFGSRILVVDLKGEYVRRLRLDSSKIMVLNLSRTKFALPRSLDECSILVNILSTVYSLTPYARQRLYEALTYVAKGYELDVALEIVRSEPMLGHVLQTLFTLFDPLQGTELGNALVSDCVIVDISSIHRSDPNAAIIASAFVVLRLLKSLQASEARVPRYVLVLDEAWSTLAGIPTTSLPTLVRYMRSFGVALFVATQSIEDLGPNIYNVVSNVGLFIALACASSHYWESIAQYVGIPRSVLRRARLLRRRGECLIKTSSGDLHLAYFDPS